MNRPLTSGDFDPLRPPGSTSQAGMTTTAAFRAGQFVRASLDNTAFFKVRPKADADADKLLTKGTSMKVVSISGSYAKVELDSGEVGFVPTVMIEDPNTAPQAPMPGSGEYQIYPPLPGGGTGVGEPLPPLDPTGLPPEGAIPTVIDPDAPSNNAPVPPVTPTTDTFPTVPPVTPDSTPPPVTEEKVPLPPSE